MRRARGAWGSLALAAAALFSVKGCFLVLDYGEYEGGSAGQGGGGGTSGPGGGPSQGGGGQGGMTCEGGGTPERPGNTVDENCDDRVCAPPLWSRRDGGDDDVILTSLLANSLSGTLTDSMILAGSFKGTLDLGGASMADNTSASEQAWIARLDAETGDPIWLFWPGNGDPEDAMDPWGVGSGVRDLALSGAGTILSTGYRLLQAGGEESAFLSMRNPTGSRGPRYLTFSATGGTRGEALAVGNADAVYLAGSFAGNLIYDDPSPGGGGGGGAGGGDPVGCDSLDLDSNTGSRDIMLLHLGGFASCEQGVWGASYGGPGAEDLFDIAVDGAGIVMTGSYQQTFSPVTPPQSAGASGDILVMKATPSGTLLWARGFISSLDNVDSAGRAVAIDEVGNVYVTGSFHGTTTFDDGLVHVSQGEADVFVAKLTPSGAVLWVRPYGGPGDQIGTDIAITPDGGTIQVTGVYAQTLDLGPAGQLMAGEGQDLFFLQLNGDGDVTCSGSFGAGFGTAGPAVRLSLGQSGNVHLAGSWGDGSLDFGSNSWDPRGLGGLDLFVARFGP